MQKIFKHGRRAEKKKSCLFFHLKRRQGIHHIIKAIAPQRSCFDMEGLTSLSQHLDCSRFTLKNKFVEPCPIEL